MSIPPQLQLIRESLAGLVAPDVASAVLLGALEEWGEALPSSQDDVLAFVRGPLFARVRARAGLESAREVVAHIERVLGVPPSEGGPSRRKRSNLTTVAGRRTGTVRLVVVASSSGLAERLRVALGGEGLAVVTATEPGSTTALVTDLRANVVLFDARDAPLVPVDSFVEPLTSVPDDVVRIIWSSGEGSAERLFRALDERDVRVVSLDRREGVEPLLDLLRANR